MDITGIAKSHQTGILFRGQVYNITFIDNVKYQNKTMKLRAALEKR